MRDKTLLRQLQALPLNAKVLMTQQRIREWYNYWNGHVCISFSGGKDSTVLTHLVHDMYPDVPLVFANTGLEYPEIQAFARKMGAEFVRPKMSFSEVISKYGYPIIGKEVAEAIHFARRIVLTGGGTATSEIQGQRQDGNGRSWRENGRTNFLLPPGGITRTNRMEESEPPRQHTAPLRGSAEVNLRRTDILGRRQNYEPGTSSMPPPTEKIGTARDKTGSQITPPPHYQTNRTGQKTAHGDGQIGERGDEKQLPG